MSLDSSNEIKFEDWLHSHLYRASCPSTLALGEYAQGLLPEEARSQLMIHVRDCPVCRKELIFWNEFLAEETDESVVKKITEPLDTVRRLIAQLQVPGAGLNLRPAWGALRGATGNQVIYEVEDIQILISMQSDPEQPNLSVINGLIIGLESIGLDNELVIQAVLKQDNHSVISTLVDDIGNFIFPSLNKGEYQLMIHAGEVKLVVENLLIP